MYQVQPWRFATTAGGWGPCRAVYCFVSTGVGTQASLLR